MSTAMKVTEGIFTIVFVGLILSHADQFSTLARGAGRAYSSLVRGLQG